MVIKGYEKMKKIGSILALILIISLSTNSAFAQLIGAGIKVGASFANLQDDDYIQDFDSKTGFIGGAFITLALNDIIAVQPEALYVFKGAKFTSLGGTIEGEVIYDYLEIPILIKAMLPTSSKFKPSVFAGPSLSILTNSKVEVTTPPGYLPRSVRDETSSTDFGLTFGAGVDFMLPQGKITLDGRYDLGLTGTFEIPVTYTIQGTPFFRGDDKMKNSVMSVMLGFSFM
jgi:hypothetical protein